MCDMKALKSREFLLTLATYSQSVKGQAMLEGLWPSFRSAYECKFSGFPRGKDYGEVLLLSKDQ